MRTRIARGAGTRGFAAMPLAAVLAACGGTFVVENATDQPIDIEAVRRAARLGIVAAGGNEDDLDGWTMRLVPSNGWDLGTTSFSENRVDIALLDAACPEFSAIPHELVHVHRGDADHCNLALWDQEEVMEAIMFGDGASPACVDYRVLDIEKILSRTGNWRRTLPCG